MCRMCHGVVSLPSPLWGGVGGGGTSQHSPPTSLALLGHPPHQGEGNGHSPRVPGVRPC
jgi:hypothetical protein